jgi:hypothetical protein
MTELRPVLTLRGERFSPRRATEITRIELSNPVEPVGRSDLENAENHVGAAILEVPSSIHRHRRLEWLINVAAANLPSFQQLGATLCTIHVEVRYWAQCDLEFTPEQLKRIGSLGIPFTVSCRDYSNQPELEPVGKWSVEYDDDREVTRFVWDFYSRFLTNFEGRVGNEAFAQAKAAVGSQGIAEVIRRRHGLKGDPTVDAALANGVEAFRRRVCRRILEEHGADIAINRCPKCDCVVRTPKSRQCFWCGFDWH